MRIKFKNNTDDLLILNDYLCEHSTAMKKIILKNRIMMAISPLVGVMVLVYIKNIPMDPAIFIFAFMGIILSLPLFFYYPRYFKRSTRKNMIKLYGKNKNKGVMGVHEISIENDGLVAKTEYNETKLKWGSIENIVTFKGKTLIFTGAMQAHVVPEDAIIDGDYKAFTDELISSYNKQV